MSGETFTSEVKKSRILSTRIRARKRRAPAVAEGGAQPPILEYSALLAGRPQCVDRSDSSSQKMFSQGRQHPSTVPECVKNYPGITHQPTVVLCDIMRTSLHSSCGSASHLDLVRLKCTPARIMPELKDHCSVSDSCQRVKPFVGKEVASCARTYMPWPFEKKGPSSTDGLSLEPLAATYAVISDSSENERLPLSHQTNDLGLNGTDHVSGENKDENEDENKEQEATGHNTSETECLQHQVDSISLGEIQKMNHSDCSEPEEQKSSPRRDEPTSDGLDGVRNGARSDGCVLDEVTAYEQDILIVNVIQDELDLCDDFPQSGWIKDNPERVEKKTTHVPTDTRLADQVDLNGSRPFQVCVNTIPGGQKNRSKLSLRMRTSWTGGYQNHNMINSSSNQHFQGDHRRVQLNQTSGIPQASGLHPCATSHFTNSSWFRQGKRLSQPYCRLFFSQSLNCSFKNCRFQHVPQNGDEQFCIESMERFTLNPGCLHKAGAVFRGYYQNNAPGMRFSLQAFLSLLWRLLEEGMVTEILAVLTVSLEHRIVPELDFTLALFTYVREKCLSNSIPQLMQVTSKMARAGLVLNLDCFNYIQNIPEIHQINPLNSNIVFSGNPMSHSPFAHDQAMAPIMVEIELYSNLGNWKQLGEFFRFISLSNSSSNKLEIICVRIATVLLSDRKEQTSLPFVDFAKAVCQNEKEESTARYFLGRIGLTLMITYHQLNRWDKGRNVVEVLSFLKINYSMSKGLFLNHNLESRCSLITVASKLFLSSGGVVGALNTLKENKWFVRSSEWPCSPADLEDRHCLLIKLSEKVSCRERLEVLSHLPGITEQIDMVDISKYTPFFITHLKLCMEKALLVVASDTVEYMFSKRLFVERLLLQQLLCKLVEKNKWPRARQVFKQSFCVGHYSGVSVASDLMTLPWELLEVEFALHFEKLIAVKAAVILSPTRMAHSFLTIILKRTVSSESEYLNASSRLLSAAGLLTPKIDVRYTEVNLFQEQVFALDIGSARDWLQDNQRWTKDLWMD